MSDAIKNTQWSKEERLTGAVPCITTDHTYIHEKIAYTLPGRMDVASAGVGAVQLTIPAAVAASLTTNMTNALADVTLTAVNTGTDGNSIRVVYVDPSANNAPLTVSVVGGDITVSLATGVAGAITSTGAQVAAAINANADAALLVTAADEGDGSGVVNAVNVASLAGGTNATYCHFKPASVFSTAGPILVDFIEDKSFEAAGTAVVPRNRHRINGPASKIPCKQIAAATLIGDSSLTLDHAGIAGSTTGGKIGGSVAAAEEWPLCPGKTYIISFTNATNPGATASVTYSLFWYEETGA